MQVMPIRGSIFRPHQDLAPYIFKHVPVLLEGMILVVTSKIVAMSEGRVAENGEGVKERLVLEESEEAIQTAWCYVTKKDGHWCPNAGIDSSNADGQLVLWPVDAYAAAASVRRACMDHYGIEQNFGVLMTDSRVFPLRAGVTGVALGYAGFKGLRDYRGKPDIFGEPLTMTQTNIADTLASASVLVMGEGNEQTPLGIVLDAPVEWSEEVDRNELTMDPEHDLYRPLFER